MFKKILVPLDGSALSEEVLPLVGQMLKGGVPEATLFIATTPPRATRRRRAGPTRDVPIGVAAAGSLVPSVLRAAPPVYAETTDQAVERREHELLEYLIDAGRSLVATGASVRADVRFGDPAKEIIAYAKRGRFDCIVMATHGRSGLRRTLHGSVTSSVVRSGVAPVLVLRPKRKRAARIRRPKV